MKAVLENRIKLFDVPAEIEACLTDGLTMENPKWLENQRMGRWNGRTPRKLKYYSRLKNSRLIIPRGYMRPLIYLCKDYQVDIEIEDRRRSMPEVEFEFCGVLKPFQKKAVDVMLAKDFGTMSAPTGAGKTVMALNIIAARKQPAVIVVHTKDLAFQWIRQIENFLQIPPGEVGLIGSGSRRPGDKISVALVQSLYKCADEIYERVGHIVVDEYHRTPSRTFTEAVTAFDSRYMLGLSATPFRRDRLSSLIFWHLGGLYHEMKSMPLLKSGDVLTAEIHFRKTAFVPYVDPVRDYSRMLSELTRNEDRNRQIVDDVCAEVESHEGICLVLSDRKKHCELLTSLLRYRGGIQAAMLTGDLSTSQRQDVLESLNNGDCRVLVATGQLIGEGFDCRALSTLFLSTPIRFSGHVLQYLGRVLRPAPGKAKAIVYDYVDIEVDVLTAAAKARKRTYENSGSHCIGDIIPVA